MIFEPLSDGIRTPGPTPEDIDQVICILWLGAVGKSQRLELPIEFLLHDEVQDALRRGFWEALENKRRQAG